MKRAPSKQANTKRGARVALSAGLGLLAVKFIAIAFTGGCADDGLHHAVSEVEHLAPAAIATEQTLVADTGTEPVVSESTGLDVRRAMLAEYLAVRRARLSAQPVSSGMAIAWVPRTAASW